MTKKPTSPNNRLKVKLKDQKKRTLSSRRWLERQLNDPYVQKAKDDGYRSRAAYKILEINNKFKLFKPGQTVVDLGAAPGGWTQVAVELCRSTAAKPRVIGVDLTEIADIPGAILIQADFLLEETQEHIRSLLEGKVDVIVSDMAAPACGMTDVDHVRIMLLVEDAYSFAKEVLKPGGAFVAKVLRGGTEDQLLKQMKASFKKVAHFKPPASRQGSAEMYVVATGFKGDTQPKSAAD